MARTCLRPVYDDPVSSIAGNDTRVGAGARSAPGAFTLRRSPAGERARQGVPGSAAICRSATDKPCTSVRAVL
ncbi:hypothetical protein ABT009_39140 [Streptomyces sp. NPDC002896]|uniref:hypothetical protein n=1 Tax=Streptomyces sp. NPDC002896 TaxID=3154438 RepID=UPI00332CF211